MNSTWDSFQTSMQTKYIPEYEETSGCIPEYFENIIQVPDYLHLLFKGRASRNQYGIARLEANLPTVIENSFPQSWFKESSLYVSWSAESKSHPSLTNIKNTWRHLNKLPNIDSFQNLPLLPAAKGTILIKISKSKKSIDCSGHDESLVKFLADLEIKPILSDYPEELSHHLKLYTEKLNADNLVQILKTAPKSKVVHFLNVNRAKLVEVLSRDSNKSMLLTDSRKKISCGLFLFFKPLIIILFIPKTRQRHCI